MINRGHTKSDNALHSACNLVTNVQVKHMNNYTSKRRTLTYVNKNYEIVAKPCGNVLK